MSKRRPRITIEELEETLTPDPNSLDEEWVRNPQLSWVVAEAAARANNDREVGKVAIEAMCASVSDKVRSLLSKKEVKFTETGIREKVELDPEVVSLRGEYLQLKLEADRWQAFKEAMTQRSYSLKHLSELFISEYFQKSSASSGTTKATESGAERNRTRARERFRIT